MLLLIYRLIYYKKKLRNTFLVVGKTEVCELKPSSTSTNDITSKALVHAILESNPDITTIRSLVS